MAKQPENQTVTPKRGVGGGIRPPGGDKPTPSRLGKQDRAEVTGHRSPGGSEIEGPTEDSARGLLGSE